MGKYNLLYQEQFTLVNGSALCSWSQFIKRKFASHIITQRPSKFFKNLQQLLIDDRDCISLPLTMIDQDTGLLINLPTEDLHRQITATVRCTNNKEPNNQLLKPYF